MALVSQTIKNFIAGVSQQPPILRHTEQLETQINGFSTEAGGLQKRPPSIYIKNLGTGINEKSKVHIIDRDESERYALALTGDDIKVWDLQGNAKTVSFDGNSKSYITTDSPRKNLKVITVADYTFIVNTSYIAKLKADVAKDTWASQGALVHVKSGQYGRTYVVKINGSTVASYQTPDGSRSEHVKNIDTHYIAEQLSNQIAGKTGSVNTDTAYNNALKEFWGNQYRTYLANKTDWENQYGKFEPDAFQVQPGFPKRFLTWHSTRIDNVSSYIPWGFGAIDDLDDAKKFINNSTEFDKFALQYMLTGRHPALPDRNAVNNQVGTLNVTLGDSWLYIYTNGYNDITKVETEDGFNNQAMRGILTSIQNFTDLPATAPDGFTVLVAGQANSTSDDYYVRYDASSKLWKETVKPSLTNEIDADTMPHSLVRQADGTFLFTTVDWSERTTGDDESNPKPSFIDTKINDVFFFRNRLGIVAGESVNLSSTGDFFNYWLDSATGVLDTDPIDISVSHNRVSTLYNAVPFNQDLYLFSAQTQFVLHADGVLSPKNAQIDQVTEFSGSTKLKPIGVGRNLYFTSERADFTTVREYYAVYDSTNTKDSTDVTSHVPDLLPNPIYELIASNNENMLMALSEGAPNSIFVYKYLFLNNAKVQASWSTWTFNGTILGGNFIDSTLYFLIKRGANVYLEKLLINYSTRDFPEVEPYRCMLDRKVKVTLQGGTYDEYKNTYTIDPQKFLQTAETTEEYVLVLKDGRVYRCKYGEVLTISPTENLEGTEAILGTTYTFIMGLTTLYIKKADETGTTMVPNYRLVIRGIDLNYTQTGEFDVIVSYVGKPTRRYKMTTRQLGEIHNVLGSHALATGNFKVPIQDTNTNVQIEIHNDSPLPCALNGMVWTANVNVRYRSI